METLDAKSSWLSHFTYMYALSTHLKRAMPLPITERGSARLFFRWTPSWPALCVRLRAEDLKTHQGHLQHRHLSLVRWGSVSRCESGWFPQSRSMRWRFRLSLCLVQYLAGRATLYTCYSGSRIQVSDDIRVRSVRTWQVLLLRFPGCEYTCLMESYKYSSHILMESGRRRQNHSCFGVAPLLLFEITVRVA
jgi:hypothetical protein